MSQNWTRFPVHDNIMKILHLISSHGLFGAENVVLNLSGALNTDGMTAIVGAINNTTNPHLEIVERARELHQPTYVLDCSGQMDFGAVRRLKNYIRDNNIRILHTHNYKSDTLGVLAAKWAGIPIVATAHGFTGINQKVSLYEKWDRWLLRRLFDTVVVVSDKVLPDIAKEKKRVIANGLDLAKFARGGTGRAAARRRFGFTDDELVVATAGRLSREKNQALFVAAAADMVKQFSKIKFLIVGNGPEEDNLRRQVSGAGLGRHVVFAGLVADMPAVYQAIDIFTLTSLTEGVPLTILEAMAAEVPVVATKVGGIPELIQDGQTGLLAAPENKNDLVAKFSRLIKDPSLRLQLSRAALNFVKAHYSKERMARDYAKVYEEILNGRT